MKVGVVSDSPAVTTGYGIVTDYCCRALLRAGHEVICFGFKDTPDNPLRQSYPCRILPIDSFSRWHQRLRGFATSEGLDVLWIYMDMHNLKEVMDTLDTKLPPLSLYAIFDGLPVYKSLTDCLGRFRTIVVTTQAAAAYLEAEGYPVHAVAPPGVDLTVFRPLDRQALRRQAGIDDAFLIGAFGRNTERKQQPRLLQALRSLASSGDVGGLLLYLHCSRRGYWDLHDLATRWGVRQHMLFPEDLVDETRGVAVRGYESTAIPSIPRIPASFGYVERLNLCDLVINVPHCGDFEQVLIEAPACGVPVAGTDDTGVMREALGPGWPLVASEWSLGKSGQIIRFVAIDAIMESICALRSDISRRKHLADAGRRHAALHDWSRVCRAIVSAVETTVENQRK